ncbi:MAG: hypothetical protein JWO11_4011 [Nocardioides sp.]|nr:hypothetical protein [Nocardioides sp.]
MAHRWDPKAPRVVGLVRPVRVDPTGQTGPTRGQAQGGRWRRTSTGFYVRSNLTDERVEQRILEQSMRISATGAVTGWAALRLHGGNFFDGLARDGKTRLPVPIAAASDRFEAHPDIVRIREPLVPAEVVVRHGVRCTIVARAVFDEMRRVGEVREAVVVMDMAAAADLISIPSMQAYAAARSGRKGTRLVLAALDLADGGSRSPAETRFRLIWELDAGWPRPLTNRWIFDLDGRFLGVPDLLDPDLGIVGEYDGADHRGIARHRRDVRREDAFRRAGLEYVEVVGSDLHDPPLVVERMEAARARAGRMPRGWSLDRRERRRE